MKQNKIKKFVRELLSLIGIILLIPVFMLILGITWFSPSEEEKAIESWNEE